MGARWTRCHGGVAAVALLVVVVVGCASALTGSQMCPTSVDTTDMAAWCTARFGGFGGTLSASPWDTDRQSFSCICNANADAALTIQRQTSPSSSSSSVQSGSSTQGKSSATSPSSDSMSGVAVAPSDWLSDSVFGSGLSASSSMGTEVVANATCSWSGVFTGYPDGTQCTATTGLCPASCSSIPSNLCNNPYTNSESCTDVSAYVVSYTCLTCNGRNFTISSRSVDNCTRYYSVADTCDAKSSCNGHGCCVGATSATGVPSTTCTCFSDNTNGYYTGGSCSSCENGYTTNAAGLCLSTTNKVQFILASIAKTWTMVAPNMAVLFLFVIFGVTRKLNASDRPFDLTGLRRANLSTVQVARRRQQSLFHSKYIPMRPAKSRSFANPHQPQGRGPPAF